MTQLEESLKIISNHVNYSKTDLYGIITEVSNAFCNSSLYTRDELIGQQHNITRHLDMPASIFKEMWDTIQTGKIWKGKIKNRSKDGNYYWSDTVITPRYNSNGDIEEYMAIRHNITTEERLIDFNSNLEQKVKEKTIELENNLNITKALLDSVHEGVIMFNSDNKCISMNDVGLKMYQVEDESDVIGINIFEHVTKDSISIITKNILENNLEPYEISCLRKDGTPYPALVKGKTLILNNETFRITSILDITDIKRREKLLIEQSKMAAMGEMMESIVHQWRQPLSVISTASSGITVQKDYGLLTDEILVNSCNHITKNAEYLSDTITDFKNFFNKDKVKQSFNTKDIFYKTLSLLASKFKNQEITVKTNIDDININGFGNELVQVFMNILNNARDELETKNYARLISIDIYIKKIILLLLR